MKKNLKQKNSKRKKNKIIAASLIILLIISFGFTKTGREVYSLGVSKLKNIFFPIEIKKEDEKSYSATRDIAKYKDIINKSVESNNAEIMITEILLQDDKLRMNFAIALKDEKVGAYEVRIGDMKDGEFGEKLTINGLSFYGSAGSSYQGMLD